LPKSQNFGSFLAIKNDFLKSAFLSEKCAFFFFLKNNG